MTALIFKRICDPDINSVFNQKFNLMQRWYLLIMLWGLSLWGVLQLNELTFAAEHSVCGLWGCGPPLQALIVCHLFWVVLFFPLLLIVPRHFSNRVVCITGLTLACVGFSAIIGVGLYESFTWLPQAANEFKRYYFHRWGFSVITKIDLPMTQLLVLGLLFWLQSRFFMHRGGWGELPAGSPAHTDLNVK